MGGDEGETATLISFLSDESEQAAKPSENKTAASTQSKRFIAVVALDKLIVSIKQI